MINDFRIEKDRLSVSLTTVSGETLAGELFVQRATRHRVGPEEAPDILNAPEPFFAFLTRDGKVQLVAKRHVREMELTPDVEAEEWLVDAGQEIEVVLVGGVHHTGVLYLNGVSGRTRVIDSINRTTDHFLTLHTGGSAVLVNRELIERIRPID